MISLRALSLIKRTILLSLFCLLNSISASSQIDVVLTQATAQTVLNNPHHWQILLGFDKGIDLPKTLKDAENPDVNPIKNPKTFRLIEIETGQKIDIIHTYFDQDEYFDSNGNYKTNAGLPGAISIYLDPSIRLDPEKHYHLYVFNVMFEGQAASSPPQRSVNFVSAGSASTATAAGNPEQIEQSDKVTGGDSISTTAADGREDANIYVSGQIVAATGNKPNFTGDIKVEIPIKKVIGNRIHDFNPFFELNIGQGPDVDPDSMKLGLNWQFPVWRYRSDNLDFPIRRVLLKNAPQLEAEKDWDNVNFVVDSRFRFISKSYIGPHATFYFRPFIGQEFGRNLKSPVSEAEGNLIYRGLAGTTMNLTVPINKAGIYNFTFEGDYTRRWLLKREIGFQESDDSGFQPLYIGKGPRDYLSTKFSLNFTKSFGGTVTYEYGSVPPSFKFVNHKVSIGLTYKVKID